MLREFAINPEVLSDWKDFRYIIDQCQPSHGRLIVRFPSRWIKLAVNACENSKCKPVRRKSMIERLLRLKGRLIHQGRQYDNSLSWLDNAIGQNQIRSFHAIINTEILEDTENVIGADELQEQTSLWSVNRETKLLRTGAALGEAVAPLLKVCRKAIFVDPHFDPGAKRFQRPLSHFMRILNGNAVAEYHLLDEERRTKATFDQNTFDDLCRQHLASLIPSDKTLRVVRWRKRLEGISFHARFVLTDIWGIRIDYGLDEGKKGETTDASLLDNDTYQEKWKNYHTKDDWQRMKPDARSVGEDIDLEAYEFVGETLIIGTKADR